MYSDRLKEIIAFLEIEFRGHPLPVLNDIRGLHELMAACFDMEIQEDEGDTAIGELLDAAEETYAYAVANCYHGAIYKYGKRVALRYRWAKLFCNIKSVADGDFYKEHEALREHAAENLKEGDDFFDAAYFTEAYEPYRETLNCLVSMDNLFDDHLRRINHAVWTGIVVRAAVAIVAICFLAALIVKYFG